MRLFDRIAQCRSPFIVESSGTKNRTRLNGAADFAAEVVACPTRFVLSDELTRLCSALAYSKGADTLECADLLHIPDRCVWVEWCDGPWRDELVLYGFKQRRETVPSGGRRGAFIRASSDGRRGLIRNFWTVGESPRDILAGSMEAYFDLDVPKDEEPEPPDGCPREHFAVADYEAKRADVLRQFFRFRYESSWAAYYDKGSLSAAAKAAVAYHALGTIAADIPVLLAFFLLLGTRGGLPQRAAVLERLNRARTKTGKPPLLDHVEVRSPLLPSHHSTADTAATDTRKSPRLHRVRGHLVRRGSQLFWRVPHLRGTSRAGAIKSRTVVWTFDSPAALDSRFRAIVGGVTRIEGAGADTIAL